MQGARDISLGDPLKLFDSWMRDAQEHEPNDPNAAALATCSISGRPSVRMVLVKPVGEHRFSFFTNAQSRKGIELAENPQASLCFHWKSLRRQVRVEGFVAPLPPADVDHYFHSRSRASQIGAAVSRQSRVLSSREALQAEVQAFTETHQAEIPRPEYWRGYFIKPERIEFWMDGANRLHDRFLFTLQGGDWEMVRLYP